MSISLFFAGDLVLSKARGEPLLSPSLHRIISSVEVACCNFEGPVTIAGQSKARKLGPHLTQDGQTMRLVREAGFGLLSLANNHIMDYGPAGLEHTLREANDLNLAHIGAGMDMEMAYTPFIFKKDGITVGIISTAENGFGASLPGDETGFSWFDTEAFETALGALLARCDRCIVICHGGAENWYLPLPEYRRLYRSWIDRGVSAVIAHHPHVPQGYEAYRDGFIFYSLGNFAFDKGTGILHPRTICALLVIDGEHFHAEPVYTEFSTAGVQLCDDPAFKAHIAKCCDSLIEPLYTVEINRLCLRAYQDVYRQFYGNILNMYGGNFRQLVKRFLFRMIRRQRFSDEWLFHNLAIETHCWICRRAATLILQQNKESK